MGQLGCCIATYCCLCKVDLGNKVSRWWKTPKALGEEEEDNGLPGVPKAPQVRTRKRPASPQEKPTQHMEASGQHASVDLK